jgi:hypothetical protein
MALLGCFVPHIFSTSGAGIMDDTFEKQIAGSSTGENIGSRAAPLEKIVIKPALATMGTPEHATRFDAITPPSKLAGRRVAMGDGPGLAKMSAAPTLAEFFEKRLAPQPVNHMLQSASLALKAGASEPSILACLLHDIAMAGLVQSDHGYWGAQLIEPYVDPEITFAVRYHQALRFFPDPEADYDYPQAYIDLLGADYVPEPYLRADYEYARSHEYYATARLITLNDIYSFDPDAVVKFEDFTDIIGRHFRQPKEGLGFDNSPVAHMWRTLIWPHNFL